MLEDLEFQIDFSSLMDAFEIAYGLEWLAEYLEEHIDEIDKLY